MITQEVKRRFQRQQVWPGQREQPRPQHDGEPFHTIDHFLSEAHATAPLFAGMIVTIMPEDSSGPPNTSPRSWGLVEADHAVLMSDKGGGAGAGHHGDCVRIQSPTKGEAGLWVRRSRVERSTAFEETAMKVWAAAGRKGDALANLSTAAAHEAYRDEVKAAGGLWTADQVRAALTAAPKLQASESRQVLDENYDSLGVDKSRVGGSVKVPEGKELHHLVDFSRRFKKDSRFGAAEERKRGASSPRAGQPPAARRCGSRAGTRSRSQRNCLEATSGSGNGEGSAASPASAT
ncbi:unnamed protein product [Ectocarpus fasciculatus]